MPIVRAPRPQRNFTIIENTVIRDHKLTFRARGILAYILSMPDHWSTSSDHLSRVSQEGRDAIRRALRELETAGYLQRKKLQDAQGRWVTQTLIFDAPQLGDLLWTTTPSYPLPKTDFQASDNQALIEELTIKDITSSSSETLSIREHVICGLCRGTGTVMNGLTSVACPGNEGYPHA